MENYQILGLVGSILLIPAIFTPYLFMVSYNTVYYAHYAMMNWMMPGFTWLIFPFMFIGIPAIILGLIGSLISDKLVGGILLIIAAVLSIPLFFGFFGISLALLLASGILALTKK